MDQLIKLVAARLRKSVAGAHLTADALSAFAEQGLTDEQREQALAHLVDCADCRQVFYLAVPEAPQNILALKPHRGRFAWRWTAVTASVAIVLSAVVVRYEVFPVRPQSAQSSTQVASNEPYDKVAAEKTPAQISEMRAAEAAPKSSGVSEPSPEPRRRPEPKHMTAKPKVAMNFEPSGQVQLTGRDNAAKDLQLTNSPAANEKKTQAHNEVLPALGGPVAVGAFAKERQASLNGMPRVQWSLSPQGVLQQSGDQGTNWRAVSVIGNQSFRTLSAVGSNLWVGGNAGILYHSSDSGEHWTRVAPVAHGQPLQGDIVRVDFPDAQEGTVHTSTGETWVTTDGGQTWNRK